jgi:glycine cleavage system protein P-like pyridoxal-binding family
MAAFKVVVVKCDEAGIDVADMKAKLGNKDTLRAFNGNLSINPWRSKKP